VVAAWKSCCRLRRRCRVSVRPPHWLLAEAGADVVLIDRNLEGAQPPHSEIRTAYRGMNDAGVRTVTCLDPQAIADLFRTIDSQFATIDFLGNIAGDGCLARP
jgi:NAD(P)-dependent dehydrogenase (short-subunit alcohol dehydrogenase family)